MKNVLLTVLLLSLLACGGENGAFSPAEMEAQTKAYQKMMEGHDRVMPRMGEIAQAQKGLADAMKAEGLDDERKTALQATYDQLDNSYDGMMVWMRELKSPDELLELKDQQKILDYIKGEDADMAVIETQLNKGIEMTKQLLGEDALKQNHDGHDHDGHDHHDHDGHDHDGHDHSGHDHGDHKH
ncbi:MAG: hypothetical protein AAF840_16395 [Bacteroidota bacterium]